MHEWINVSRFDERRRWRRHSYTRDSSLRFSLWKSAICVFGAHLSASPFPHPNLLFSLWILCFTPVRLFLLKLFHFVVINFLVCLVQFSSVQLSQIVFWWALADMLLALRLHTVLIEMPLSLHLFHRFLTPMMSTSCFLLHRADMIRSDAILSKSCDKNFAVW